MSKRLPISIPVALCLLSLAGGCDEPAEPRIRTAPLGPTHGSPAHGSPAHGSPAQGATAHGSLAHGVTAQGATSASDGTRGTVRETMNAAGYTYLRVESGDGTSSWVAATEMPLEVGDEVLVEGGSEMVGFHSRTLDRTFDRITFASSVRVTSRAEGTAPTPAPLPPGHPAVGSATPTPAVAELPASGGTRGVVRETMSSGGYTYMRVEGSRGSAWVAVREMTVAVGDEVEVEEGMEMPGFHSRTLDRTFDQITFAPGARVLGTTPSH